MSLARQITRELSRHGFAREGVKDIFRHDTKLNHPTQQLISVSRRFIASNSSPPTTFSPNYKKQNKTTRFSSSLKLENFGVTNADSIRSRISTNGISASKVVHLRRKRVKPVSRRQAIPRSGAQYPVKAIHLGQTINLSTVMEKVFSPLSVGQSRKSGGKNSLVLELPPSESPNGNQLPKRPRYMAVYGFGSVVGINIAPLELQSFLTQIRRYVTDPVNEGSERREDFGIMLQPSDLYPSHVTEEEESEEKPSSPIITGDYCVVSDLDLDGVAVISHIMAQTVALDTYNDISDELLRKFAAINSSVRASGKFKGSDKSFLFKSVAHNNAIFIDMISKIRLKDRSDTAWKITKYEDIHYGLKSEFEIDDRFDQIEYKLNLIQQNSKFFLEVMDSEKSNSLEWTIVWLIGAECILMCVDMSGYGEVCFAYLSSFMPS